MAAMPARPPTTPPAMIWGGGLLEVPSLLVEDMPEPELDVGEAAAPVVDDELMSLVWVGNEDTRAPSSVVTTPSGRVVTSAENSPVTVVKKPPGRVLTLVAETSVVKSDAGIEDAVPEAVVGADVDAVALEMPEGVMVSDAEADATPGTAAVVALVAAADTVKGTSEEDPEDMRLCAKTEAAEKVPLTAEAAVSGKPEVAALAMLAAAAEAVEANEVIGPVFKVVIVEGTMEADGMDRTDWLPAIELATEGTADVKELIMSETVVRIGKPEEKDVGVPSDMETPIDEGTESVSVGSTDTDSEGKLATVVRIGDAGPVGAVDVSAAVTVTIAVTVVAGPVPEAEPRRCIWRCTPSLFLCSILAALSLRTRR